MADEPPSDCPRQRGKVWPRHPVTGRFLAFDCERDCLDYCAGLCGVMHSAQDDTDDG